MGKRAMITSDTQLETPKPVPAGEGPKDDIAANSHPAGGTGAPVLDGELHSTERPNVNAMREALETQSEMEVGVPVDQKQEEVKTEKEVTVEKGSGTQIIINIAGKQKKLGFTNKATAAAFIKGASEKFGNKFKVVSASVVTLKSNDRISWKLNQFGAETRQGVVVDVLPQNEDGLAIFDAKQEDLGGNPKGDVWGYMGLVYEINGQQVKPVNSEAAEFEIIASSQAPRQDADNDAPVTSGMGDINGAAPNFKGAAQEKKNQRDGYFPSDAKNRKNGELRTRAVGTREYVIAVGNRWATKDVAGDLKLTTSLQNAYKYDSVDGGAEAKQDAAIVKNGIGQGEQVQITPSASLPSLVAGEKEAAYPTPSQFEHCHETLWERPADYAEWVEHQQPPKKPVQKEKGYEETMKAAGFNFSPSNVPSQVLQEFYPEIQHELVSYPNVTNAPMQNPEITGDAHELGTGEAEGIGEATLVMNNEDSLPDAIEDAFEGMTRIGYVSTSPAGACGIGRDGKPQVLEGAHLHKENDIRNRSDEFYTNDYEGIPSNALHVSADENADKNKGPMFLEGFYATYNEGIPGSALAAITAKVAAPLANLLAEAEYARQEGRKEFDCCNCGSKTCKGKCEDAVAWRQDWIRKNKRKEARAALKVAAADEKQQFALFLKRVMGEVAASFISAFKVTNRMPMNKVPGVGEIQLAQIEQPSMTAFNVITPGSRVKYLVEKLTDSELQDAINGAFAQAAVWCDDKDDREGSYVYECFVRAETLDSENLTLSYKFVTGTKEAD